MSRRSGVDWERILVDYSSGEDSDAHDSMNVVSVQKNAKRVAELLQDCVPGLEGMRRPDAAKPLGMNRADVIRDGLAAAMRGVSPPQPARSAESAPAGREPPAAAPRPVGAGLSGAEEGVRCAPDAGQTTRAASATAGGEAGVLV